MKISFLASHGGSAAKHIISAIWNNYLEAEIDLVITNNRDSDIYQCCINNVIEVCYISVLIHRDEEEKDEFIRQVLYCRRRPI